MILQTLQILQILLRHVLSHGRFTAVHISKHSPSHHVATLSRSRSVVDCAQIQAFTLKLTRSRLVAKCAHIQAFSFLLTKTLSRSRSVAWEAHIQAFVHKLADMLNSMVHVRNTRVVGTSTRANASPRAGETQPRLFEFTSLWHSEHCAEITLCQHFFLSHPENKNLLDSLGRRHRTKTHGTTDTWDNRGTMWCDVMQMAFFWETSTRSSAVHQAQCDAELQVRYRACRRAACRWSQVQAARLAWARRRHRHRVFGSGLRRCGREAQVCFPFFFFSFPPISQKVSFSVCFDLWKITLKRSSNQRPSIFCVCATNQEGKGEKNEKLPEDKVKVKSIKYFNPRSQWKLA